MNTNVDLYQLVECVGDAIIVADADEKIVLWNPAATRIFDYSEAEALGQALNLIVPKRQRQKTQWRLQQVHEDGHDALWHFSTKSSSKV